VRADVHEVLRLSGATSILVTHDQDEALSMADQVAVLRGGVIAQVNTPACLYRQPRDAELAQFLGEANLLDGAIFGARVRTALGELEVTPQPETPAGSGAEVRQVAGGPVRVMVRPEQLLLVDAASSDISSVVRSYEYFGHDAVVRVQPDDNGLPELVVRISGGTPLTPGARVGLTVEGPVAVWPLEPGPPADGALAGHNGAEMVRTTLA